MGENERAFAIIALFGIMGITLAIMAQLMYDNSLIINEYLTSTITLRVVQVVIIVFWQMIGVIIAAIR